MTQPGFLLAGGDFLALCGLRFFVLVLRTVRIGFGGGVVGSAEALLLATAEGSGGAGGSVVCVVALVRAGMAVNAAEPVAFVEAELSEFELN